MSKQSIRRHLPLTGQRRHSLKDRQTPAMAKPASAPSSPAPEDKTPDSDVSPLSQVPGKPPTGPGPAVASEPAESYFGRTPVAPVPTVGTSIGSVSAQGGHSHARTESSEGTSTRSSPSVAVGSPDLAADGPRQEDGGPSSLLNFSLSGGGQESRKPSYGSVSFRPPRNPSLPQGHPKQGRIRSPAPTRFRKHVGFDNIPLGEVTRSNTLGYTLSVSHYGYHPRRRSRTMMVGIDTNVYSDFALQWLLEEYADDGDEVICVHVVDKDARTVEERNYKARAEKMVERIKSKIPDNCAISIKLEYAVGKLHDTFQKLIQVYQPSMLVVGTRGRSLGGFQGLVNTNSFSKYCLQYSPIPTVVVRDYEKRLKKKEKRSADPSRHSYAAMLAATNGVHEANSENSSVYDMEARLSPDEEAHKVAAAIGLPAAFDPTLKPINLDQYLGRRSRTSSPSGAESRSPDTGATPTVAGSEAATTVSVESDEEDSGEDDEAEFEVTTATSGRALRAAEAAKETKKEQQKKLHEMEVGEAAALKHNLESDEEEEEEGGS